MNSDNSNSDDQNNEEYDEDDFQDPREWFNEYDSWLTEEFPTKESLPENLLQCIPELSQYQEDLIIDLDDETMPEVQRLATVAGSFCAVQDPHERQYSMYSEWNTQAVNELLRKNNSWWCNAKNDEIELDLAASG